VELLTPQQFKSAIYLDFEGEGNARGDSEIKKPHLAGIYTPRHQDRKEMYRCVCFKENWKPICNGVAKAEVGDFKEFFSTLAEQVKQNDQYIVFWTVHEPLLLDEFLSQALVKKLRPHLYNLHPPARKYLNRLKRFGADGSAKGKSLEECFAALKLKREPFPPFPLGPAEACRRIDRACKKNKKWRHFSDPQKGYAKDLVRYNYGDCKATWLIAKRIGNFFASLKKT